MVEISVIIPVYNAEDYMDESFNSIINQSFKDLEIICVDDGSTDNTLERLNEYAQKDKRIHVYSQENQGPGGATNTGLDKATGKYIYLMDADDTIDLNALEELHNIMEEKDVDMVIFPTMDYDEDTKTYQKPDYFTMPEVNELVGGTVFHWKDLGDLIFKISVTPWSKMYKHELIKKCGARFPLNLIYHDNPFFWEVLFNTERIYFYNKFLYVRRVHSASCTNSHDERSIDSIKINNLVAGIFLKYNHFDEYKHNLYNNKIGLVNTRYEEVRDEFKELFFEEMKKDYMKILDHERYDEFRSELGRDCLGFFNNVINSRNPLEYDLRNRILRLEFVYEDAYYELERLKHENKELTELNESILSSNSWKITEPLRKLKNR